MNVLDTTNFLHYIHHIIYEKKSMNHMKSMQLSKKTQEKINILQKKIIGNWIFLGIKLNGNISKLQSQLNLIKEEKKIFFVIDNNLILELESLPDYIESLQSKIRVPVFIKNNNKIFLISELIHDESLKEKYNIPNDIKMIHNKYGIFVPKNQKHSCYTEKDITTISVKNNHQKLFKKYEKINNTNNINIPMIQLFDKYFGLHLWFILQRSFFFKKIHKNFFLEKKNQYIIKKEKKKYISQQIAFFIGDNIEYLTIWIYKKKPNNNNNHQSNIQQQVTGHYQHFLIEGHISSFGQLQFDITTHRKELIIIIGSEKPFDEQTKHGIDLLFNQSLAELQWTGKLQYQILKK